MSSADTETEAAPEAPSDDRREALLATFTEHLGDAVVASHIRPGLGLWIRVTTSGCA